jgi:hypothetical protein
MGKVLKRKEGTSIFCPHHLKLHRRSHGKYIEFLIGCSFMITGLSLILLTT